MKIEHWGMNVPDPAAAAAWYVKNLGMKIVRYQAEPNNVHFLADDNGVKIELFHNKNAPVLELPTMHPQTAHLAFKVEDMSEVYDRLVAAGAVPMSRNKNATTGNEMAMVRDPWGLCLQLAKRPDF